MASQTELIATFLGQMMFLANAGLLLVKLKKAAEMLDEPIIDTDTLEMILENS